MKDYPCEKIKNIGLFGHHGSGKTTLGEMFLYKAGVTNRLGSVANGTSLLDYDKDEIERKCTLILSTAYFEWNGYLVNIVDTPGYMDFWGDIISGAHAIDCGLIVIDATMGVSAVTEKVYEYLNKKKKSVAIFINKVKSEKAKLNEVIEEIRDFFGESAQFLTYPEGDKLLNLLEKGTSHPSREKLIEIIVETDDALTEKYLGEEEITQEELLGGFKKAFESRAIVPIFCGDVQNDFGIKEFMDMLFEIAPVPKKYDTLCAYVFKTQADPHVGQIRYVRVFEGTLEPGMTVYNSTKKEQEKLNQMYLVRGKSREEVQKLTAGQIGALVKLKVTKTGDTLSSAENPITLEPIDFPEPQEKIAIVPKTKKDEEKVSEGLNRLNEEDPSFKYTYDTETQQSILITQGDLHLDVILSKLMSRFNVDISTERPKIHYRETFTKTVSAQGKYKRQTGGHGQYGDTWIKFEPLPRGSGFEFTDTIKGGIIPARFIPAVEKGLREAMKKGVLAGYPTTDLKATLYDGSYHEVDSSDIAFQIAASLAFKNAAEKAQPTLLEPIMEVEVIVPNDLMGDVMGDLNSRRGKILGTEPVGKNYTKIKAHVPEAEMFKYSATLNSMTQGRGSFTQKFSHYEEVPKELQRKIIEERKKELSHD